MNLATVGQESLRSPEGESSNSLSGQGVEMTRLDVRDSLIVLGFGPGDVLPHNARGFSLANEENLRKLTSRGRHNLMV